MEEETKDDKIQLSQSEMMDFIWMSYRYCIGRHTIHSHMHAETILRAMLQFSDEYKEQEYKHTANDIRREISQIVHHGTVDTDVTVNSHNFNDDIDAASVLIDWFIDNNMPIYTKNCNNKKFTIDMNSRTVAVEDIEPKHERSFTQYDVCYLQNELNDLLVWIKLANYLDNSTHRYYEFEGKVYELFPFYDIDYQTHSFRKLWAFTDKYVEKPSICSYLDFEYAKSGKWIDKLVAE